MLNAFMIALKRRRVFNVTYNELARLSNNELFDLGLNRSEIKSVAYEATYGKGAL